MLGSEAYSEIISKWYYQIIVGNEAKLAKVQSRYFNVSLSATCVHVCRMDNKTDFRA